MALEGWVWALRWLTGFVMWTPFMADGRTRSFLSQRLTVVCGKTISDSADASQEQRVSPPHDRSTCVESLYRLLRVVSGVQPQTCVPKRGLAQKPAGGGVRPRDTTFTPSPHPPFDKHMTPFDQQTAAYRMGSAELTGCSAPCAVCRARTVECAWCSVLIRGPDT